MVCVLFKHHFFLAKMNDEYRKLRPLACLYISDVRIDSLANGKGKASLLDGSYTC
jgi:hypothetical protein